LLCLSAVCVSPLLLAVLSGVCADANPKLIHRHNPANAAEAALFLLNKLISNHLSEEDSSFGFITTGLLLLRTVSLRSSLM
jgi:hypothetical protein